MNEIILELAKAHLINVGRERDKMVAQRDALNKEIEKITEFLKRGLSEVESVAIVKEESSVEPNDEMSAEAKERDLDRMPPKAMIFHKAQSELDAYAKRKDFS